ncbi:O-methylsterigmatocystin oxidoreductase [Grifola frondosa]|uniref:O-methylsterigmatocystin oxidoreductase n=1 Tax=Grifola frondosa TaxID=5627 RepID=A0A1C7MH31_GRIFR|nr:O-methylsterigmatocystin oxidoreductase [Grifola frondosa]
MLFSILISIVVLLLGYVIWDTATTAQHRRFPGPEQYPIVGNVIPTPKIWLTFAALGKKYGPIYALRTFRMHILVLNNVPAARGLLDAKSSNYWIRPFPRMIELAGMTRGILFDPDAGRLRQSRKMLNHVLSPEVWKCLEFPQHIRRIPAGIALEIAYGYKIRDGYDPFMHTADETIQFVAKANRLGAYAVDWLPFLAKLPSFCLAWDSSERRSRAQDAMDEGLQRPTLASAVMERPDEFSLDLMKFNATQIYTGGADTSITSITSFFRTMVMHPDVQSKAQLEIDQVIGNDRLPRYSDRAQLPYTNAVMTELVRCFPVVPLVTRLASKDDVHDGYSISKDTLIIINLWAMLHDETVYDEPEEFKPERWLSEDARDKPNALDVAFGFGRRACPGRYLGEETLFMTIACTLATFDISPARGAGGEEILPSGEYSDGGMTVPPPFKCTILPRSKRPRGE